MDSSIRRLLFLGLFFISSPAWATWSLLSSGQYNTGANGSFSLNTQTGGPATLLVACLYSFGGAGAISDSSNNAWTQVVNETNFSGIGDGTLQIDVSSNPITSTSDTFQSASGAGSGVYGFQVGAFTGAKTSASPIDQNNSNTTTTATSLAIGSITPSVTGELIVSCLQTYQPWTASSVSINNGTIVFQNVYTNSTVYGNAFAWYSDPSNSSINQTFSWTTGIIPAGGVVSFKPGAGSSFTPNASKMKKLIKVGEL